MSAPGPAYTAAAVDAVEQAVEHERDFPGWLSLVLACAAARKGSVGALTAGRPGSWEAALVDKLVRDRVIDDAGLEWYAQEDRRRRGGG